MDKFLIRKSKHNEKSSTGESVNQPLLKCLSTSISDKESKPLLKKRRIEVNLEDLPADPELHALILIVI